VGCGDRFGRELAANALLICDGGHGDSCSYATVIYFTATAARGRAMNFEMRALRARG
jgi:hypothetical protein